MILRVKIKRILKIYYAAEAASARRRDKNKNEKMFSIKILVI